MPRAKPRRRWAGGWVHGLGLAKTPAVKAAMLKLGKLARVEPGVSYLKLCKAVDAALSNYPGATKLDGAPRPANQRAALDHMTPHVQALRRAVDDLDTRTSNLLDIAALRPVAADAPRRPVTLDLMVLREQLRLLAATITVVDGRLAGASDSRGAEPQDGLRYILGRLATSFQNLEGGKAQDYQDRLRDFLVGACAIGTVPLPRKDRVLDLLDPSVKVPRGIR